MLLCAVLLHLPVPHRDPRRCRDLGRHSGPEARRSAPAVQPAVAAGPAIVAAQSAPAATTASASAAAAASQPSEPAAASAVAAIPPASDPA